MPDQYYDFTQVAQKLQDDFDRVEAMQGVEQFTCTTTGTTHAITGGASGYENTVFKFTADADFNKSYTTTVNGTAVQCLLPNNDEVQNNFFRSGASVLCMLDATNNKLYFVGGGGGAGGNYFFNRGVTTWASDSTYADYPYKGTINITGVTDADGVEVTFSNADATSGNYSPICATFNGGVYIWSKTQDASIVIPTICIYGRSNEDLSGEFPYLSLEGGTVRGDVAVTGNLTVGGKNVAWQKLEWTATTSANGYIQIPITSGIIPLYLQIKATGAQQHGFYANVYGQVSNLWARVFHESGEYRGNQSFDFALYYIQL